MQGNTRPIVIAVLVGKKEEEMGITDAASETGADFIYAKSMHHLRDTLLEKPCSGILLCLTALMGIDQNSKNFVQTLEQVYPVARIRWHEGRGTFALIATRSGNVETLSNFVAICSNFIPRRLRRNERLGKTLNVLLSSSPDLANATRSFTMNISVKGCFLHTPGEWNIGDTVYLQILELPTKQIIEGKVVRYVEWGVPFCAQGIGIQFANLENGVTEELRRLLYYLPAAKYPEGPSS